MSGQTQVLLRSEVKKAFDLRPLEWMADSDGPYFKDVYGRLGNLLAHGIHADGMVYPSVLLSGWQSVDWHAFVKLEGWTGGERAEK